MAKGNFANVLPVTLGYEGGYSSNKADPGNWTGGKVGKGVLKGTKYGVAASTHPNLDIKNLTVADVEPIYRVEYWNPIKGESLPPGVDLMTFDYGVNSGPARSARALQSVAGVRADGVIGPATLAAVAKADGKVLVQKMAAQRLGFLQGLTTWNTFKRGWSDRVASVEAKAVAMWLKASNAPADAVEATMQDEADKAKAKGAKQRTTAAGTAGGSAVASAVSPASWEMIALAAVAVAVVVAVYFIAARHSKARAEAYAREAAAV